MAKAHNVFREQAHGIAIVDAHARGARHILGLIDDDDREVALLDHRQIGIVVGGGVHHEPVDTRREHGRRTVVEGAVRTDRHQQQALARLLAGLSEAGDEVQGGRIAERIVERFGDHESDRPGLPGAQRARDRIRSRVTELLCGGEHPIAKIGRQLIRPVVGVGDGGPRNLQFGGQRGQRRPAPGRWTPGHGVTLAD